MSESKNVWVPGERVGDVPITGTYEEYENLLRGRWSVSPYERKISHTMRDFFDARHQIQMTFSGKKLLTFFVEGSLILNGVQLFGRTPDELVEALGSGAEAYQQPWVDDELWMVEHPMLGLLALYHEPPYDTPDSIGLSVGRQGG